MQIIEIEGISGAGKTTIVPLLARFLEDRGYKVTELKEPGTTPLGNKIRDILGARGKPISKMNSLTKMFLYLANRSDVLSSINKANYDYAIFDRFYGSTVVYQDMLGDEASKYAVRTLLAESMYCLSGYKREYVDISFILDVSPSIALKRVKERDGKVDGGFEEYNARARDKFILYSKDSPNVSSAISIDANKDIPSTYSQITDYMSVITCKGDYDV